jgi:hypothetical protein
MLSALITLRLSSPGWPVAQLSQLHNLRRRVSACWTASSRLTRRQASLTLRPTMHLLDGECGTDAALRLRFHPKKNVDLGQNMAWP